MTHISIVPAAHPIDSAALHDRPKLPETRRQTSTHGLVLLVLASVSACSAEGLPGDAEFTERTQDVIGGQAATAGEFPWQALLTSPAGSCAGSLINESWVLTAAHCVIGVNPSDMTVTLGELNRSAIEGHEQTRRALRMLRHSFDVSNREPQRNDIALIQLDRPVTLNAWVQPIRLATSDYPSGTNGIISGWGWTSPSAGTTTNVLRKVTLPIVDDDTCRDDSFGLIFDSTLCAGKDGGSPGACYGDSGGALVARANDGVWEQIGIVSFGLYCTSFTRFTRVSRFTDFVDTILQGGAPFYRLYSGSSGDHFYTTSATEEDGAVLRFGYVPESLEGAVFPIPAPGTLPLYRLFQRDHQDHFYTIFSGERDAALQGGYSDEGIAGYVFSSSQPRTIPLYRLFNSALHDHFYTTSSIERDLALSSFGYTDEGIAAYVLPI